MKFVINDQKHFISAMGDFLKFQATSPFTYIERPVLNGVNFHIHNGTLHAVATDGHRMMHVDFATTSAGEELSATIPFNIVEIMAGYRTRTSSLVLNFDGNTVDIDFGEFRFELDTLQLPYPPLSKVFEKIAKNKTKINAMYLRSALEVFGSEPVTMLFGDSPMDMITLESGNPQKPTVYIMPMESNI